MKSLQVSWDEPDLLQNVKRVSPWLVELVSNMPAIHLCPFSPPRKKLRLPQHSEFPLDGQVPLPAFSGNPFSYLPHNTPAGMQGARHAQYGLSLPNIHLNKIQHGVFPLGFLSLDRVQAPTGPSGPTISNAGSNDNISCLLTIGNSTQESRKSDNGKVAPFTLFGQPILTEKQISLSCSSDTVANSSSEGKTGNTSEEAVERSSCEGLQSEVNLEIGQCKVFMESEDIGRIIDLSLLDSYEQLYRKLADMFEIEVSDILNHVQYRDATGAVREVGDQPFRSCSFRLNCILFVRFLENLLICVYLWLLYCSDFRKTARRLTIVADSSSDNLQYR